MFKFRFSPEKPLLQYNKSDTGVIISIILLLGLGLVTLYVCSADYSAARFRGDSLYLVKRQFICALIGLVGMVFIASIRLDVIKKFLPIIFLISVIFCFLTFTPLGIVKNGARRWIRLPLLATFQPSEAIKFVSVIFMANIFDKQSRLSEDERSVIPAIVGMFMFFLIVLMQKDLSTSLLVLGTCMVMFFVCEKKWYYIVPVLFVLIPLGGLLIALEPYRVRRILAFLRPNEFLQTANFQVNAARNAIISGGLWGNGIGSGLVKMDRIPEVHADYIFAGWTEAMGLLGVTIYFVLLVFFAYRSYKVAFSTKNRFAAIGTFGFTTMIFVQSLLNCAVAAGVVPSTGIPLPFFSSGGSSMMFTMFMSGFIINASRYMEDNKIDLDLKGGE